MQSNRGAICGEIIRRSSGPRKDPMTVDLTRTLRELEECLLTPEVRGSRDAVSALLGDDFIEFGSSGVIYDKITVLAGLEGERDEGMPIERQTSDWSVRELGPDAALITYR